jgi:multiple sugar transport system substrate-binding protein
MTRKAVRVNSFSRRDFMRSLITTAGLAVLDGCCPPAELTSPSAPTPATAPTPSPALTGPVILNFMAPILQDASLDDVLKWTVDRWHEDNTLIRVEPYWTDGQSIPEKLLNLLDGGDASVDLTVMGFENIPTFIKAGYAAPLDIPDIDEFAREQVRIVTWENQVYAVPWFVDVKGYVYNKSLFRAAGLDPDTPPRTFTELIEQSAKLTQGDVYGLTYSGLKDWGTPTAEWLCVLYALGGYPMTENTDAGLPTLHTPQAIKALQMWVDWRDLYMIVPPDVAARSSAENFASFTKRMIGGWTTWHNRVSRLVTEMPPEDIGFDLPPYANPDTQRTGSWSGGWAAMVTSSSEKQAAAQAFVRFLTGDQAQKHMAIAVGRCSRNSTFTDPEVLGTWPHLQKVQEIIPYALVRPTSRHWPEMNEAIMDAISAALNEGSTPDQALEAAQERVESVWAVG